MNGGSNISFALPRAELSDRERQEMFSLFGEHFTGVTRTEFERDLAEKNRVILVRRESRLVGFSTLLAYETSFDDQPVSVIYSGDTIMAREAWGSAALARAWIATVNELRASYPHGLFYWLLLTSGFRTYRFLPVFWKEFWPRFDARAPREKQRLLDHLASERFGSKYEPRTGLVRFHHPQRLRRSLAEVPAGRMTDPHVVHFLDCNPRHAEGDELVCLASLSADNLTAAGQRMLRPDRDEAHAFAR